LRVCLRLAAFVVLAASSFICAQVSMMLRNNHSTGGASAINHGDFNNDGILDLITANISSTASVSVYLGRADGTFDPPINTNTGQTGTDLGFGDFNNDGKLVVAIVGFGNTIFQGLLGNRDVVFQPHITVLARQYVMS